MQQAVQPGGGYEPLGDRLRQRRRDLKLTLQEVADRAGLSVGFISQIERGITTPSLSSLANVSRVLGQHISTFLPLPPDPSPITRSDQRAPYSVGSSTMVYERISTNFPGSQLTTVVIHNPPGFCSEPMSHDGEEIFYVLSGSVTVDVEGDVHVLHPGDSIHFPSHKVHITRNDADVPAVFLHTCTMDVFGDRGDAVADVAPIRARVNDRARGSGRQQALTRNRGGRKLVQQDETPRPNSARRRGSGPDTSDGH